tara:strand:- start:907 stop:2124 length:1218 start_codon:yes stop_codon:yes gene_type:complete
LKISLFILSFIFCLLRANENDFYAKIQKKIIFASIGDTIYLPEGKIDIDRSLLASGLKNVTFYGHGIDKTILNFENQIEGAEGIKIINSDNIILQNFTIENSKGDLIKVEDTDGIKFINIKAQWTGGPKSSNGSYALYPVKSQNVYIDSCIAIGASDAGIYVGQSKNIIVKNSEAYYNVAGIEIENSTSADVFNNYTHNNTGGILIFDLPDLLIKKGRKIRVFNNIVINNNISNFAPPGNIVGKVPAGTGVMVLAASEVEIFNNEISNNKTANTSIVSYFIIEEPITDSLYYPYPTSIYLHDNKYKRDKQFPSLSFDQPIGFLLAYNFWRDVPDIIYDGIIDSSKIKEGILLDEYKICIENNINAKFVNLDAANNFENMSQNILNHSCSHKRLPNVKLSLNNNEK